jgi:nucleoside-diphosphate-sugar epimerase
MQRRRMTSRVHTILGAGGAIGTSLVGELVARRLPVRLVARNPRPVAGATALHAADLSNLDDTVSAVAGSAVVHLLVGLKYDRRLWRELWPRIMSNTIEACKRARAKLIFFDNVYMYGKVRGAMTEETPFNPSSHKGETRAQVATALLREMKSGNLTALIARSADFYGPHARTGIANILVFDRLASGGKAAWPANDAVPHSFTYTPDAAKSLALLASADAAWNQTWHVPTAPDPPTGAAFIRQAAKALHVAPRYRVLSRPMVKLAGLFSTEVRELHEMLYQNDSDYVFDSTKFSRAFDFEPTPYGKGIEKTAAAYSPGAS